MIIHIPFTLGFIGTVLLVIHFDYILEHIFDFIDNNSDILNNLFMKIFWNGTYIYTFVKYKCGRLCSLFPLIRSFADAICNKKVTKPKHLPEYPWASITQLVEEPSGKLNILDVKFDLTDFEWQYKTMFENLQRLNIMCKNLLLNNSTVVECLLLFAENENRVHSRVINRKNIDDIEIDVCYKSDNIDIKFLMINYIHDKLCEPYELMVDKSYFINGNQILSGAFIGKLLSDQGYTGPFDNSYKLLIIDHEIKMFEWKYTQSIEFVENSTYVIRGTDENKPIPNNSNITEDEDTKSWDKVDKE